MNYKNGIWVAFRNKILANLASVKVWLFILPFIVSTGFLGFTIWKGIGIAEGILKTSSVSPTVYNTLIEIFKNVTTTFTAWCTFNVSLVSSIVAVREIFKVQKLKAITKKSSSDAKNQNIKNKIIEEIKDVDV